MADAYKVKQDITIPRAVRPLEELPDGTVTYETEGRNYPAGSYVLADNISPPVRERIENGELDGFLEEASGDEAEAAQRLGERAEFYSTFIPEHEVEAYQMSLYGHEIVPRNQVLELRAAGAEQASTNLEDAKSAGLDERPALDPEVHPSNPELPSLAEVSRGEAENVPDGGEVEIPPGLEFPPGLPVGDDLAAAEGADVDREEKAPAAAEPAPTARRRRPASQSGEEGEGSS